MFKLVGSCLIAMVLAGCASSAAQTQTQRSQPAATEHAYSQQALDQMLAPIALYPDPLLSQILMAATYPLEVVRAARWSDAHPELEGDAAVRAAENEDWDPSVQSLVAFPRVLAMMDERIDWTEQLGEAFLAQESQVLDTVQALRQRADAAGTLRSSPDTRVTRAGNVLAIDPVIAHVVYVPYYDPRVVYGTWWWPAHPPVVWAPWPGYGRPGLSVAMQWGGGIRLSAGFFFGAFDWQRHRVNVVHVTNYYYRPKVVHRAPVQWRHEPAHRRGHAYRQAELSRRYSQPAPHAVPRNAERHTAPRVHEVTTRRPDPQPVPRTVQRRENAVTHVAPRAPRAPIATQPRPDQQSATRRATRRDASTAPKLTRSDKRPARRDAPRAPVATQPRPDQQAATRGAARRDVSSATKPRPEQPSVRRSAQHQSVVRTEKQPTSAPAARPEPQREAQRDARPETGKRDAPEAERQKRGAGRG